MSTTKRIIHKAHLHLGADTVVHNRSQVEVLHIGLGPDQRPCIWYSFVEDAIASFVSLRCRVIMTGQPFELRDREKHLGSFVENGFVGHVYGRFE